MGLLDKLKGIAAGGAAKLVDSVGGALDNIVTNKEELEQCKIEMAKVVNEHLEKMAAEQNKTLELELSDMKDARAREIAITTSENAPVLNKIIQPLLGLIVVCASLTIWGMILFRHYEPKTNESMVIGALTAMSVGVLNYYFGSSSGSKAKSDQMDKMRQEK